MRLVLMSGRVPGRAGRALRGAINGILLGILRDDQLRRLDEHYYERDVVYRTPAWNQRGLLPWERGVVEQSLTAGGRVAVIACGGGREVLALLRTGFDATGYEPHPALSAYADAFLTERGFPARVHRMARDRFPQTGPLDAVLVGWAAYSLIAPRAHRIGFLRDAAATLKDGSPVILSGFARPSHGRDLRLTARLARSFGGTRSAPPIELGDTLAPNRVHVFTRAELADELAHAGLQLESYRVVGAADPVTSHVCVVGSVR